MMTDPIADMLTRIRNGQKARHQEVDVPASKLKTQIARILKEEGFIKNYKIIENDKQGIIRVFLKYDPEGEPAIIYIRRVSKPGRRVYSKADDIPMVKNGLGVAIISTSSGIMSDRTAREKKVGGEVLCNVW